MTAPEIEVKFTLAVTGVSEEHIAQACSLSRLHRYENPRIHWNTGIKLMIEPVGSQFFNRTSTKPANRLIG
jgi:hypothetical protein